MDLLKSLAARDLPQIPENPILKFTLGKVVFLFSKGDVPICRGYQFFYVRVVMRI